MRDWLVTFQVPSVPAISGGNHDGQDGKTRDDVVGAVGKVFGAAPGPAGSTEGPQTDTQAAEHKHGGPGNGEDDSAESLWVLRRQGDMLYMVIRPRVPGRTCHA